MRLKYDVFVARRLVVCLIGTFLYAAGVCIMTRTALGASPVSSVPFALSHAFGMSLGAWSMIFYGFLILAQRMAYGRGFSARAMIMQAALSILYGFFIDLCVLLFGEFDFASYAARALCQLVGCMVLATGMSVVVMSNFTMLPGEGGVKIIAKYVRCEFGTAKIVFDCLCVASAVAICLAFAGNIAGIGEGTIFAAVFSGGFSRMLMRALAGHAEHFLSPRVAPALVAQPRTASVRKTA